MFSRIRYVRFAFALILSYETRLYLHPFGVPSFHPLGCTLLCYISSVSIVVEPSSYKDAWLLIVQSFRFSNLHDHLCRSRCGSESSKGFPAIKGILIELVFQPNRYTHFGSNSIWIMVSKPYILF